MTSYPVPPPSYGAANGSPRRASFDETRDPLLGASGSRNGYYDQPEAGDIPDDFKVRSSVRRHSFYNQN